MIRIEVPEDKEITFDEFDLMCAVAVDAKKLKKGKPIETTRQSMKTIGRNGVFLCVLAVVLFHVNRMMESPLGVLFYVAAVLGLCGLIAIPFLWLSLKRAYQTAMAAVSEGDIVFDETGIYLERNGEKPFSSTWEEFDHCYLLEDFIFLLIRKNQPRTLHLPSTESYRKSVLNGLAEGKMENEVTELEVCKGIIKVKENQ